MGIFARSLGLACALDESIESLPRHLSLRERVHPARPGDEGHLIVAELVATVLAQEQPRVGLADHGVAWHEQLQRAATKMS